MSTASEVRFDPAAKIPMKVNAFEAARQGNTQLLPLFPYLGAGDIVPCVAALASDGKATPIGYFVHTNVVDEVAVSFGSTGRVRSGDVFVGHKSHGVGGDSDQAFFAVLVITQRQLESGEQPEGMTFQCEKCATELFKYEFDGGLSEEESRGDLLPLPSLKGSNDAAMMLNSSQSTRKCKSCGHDNPPFPLHIWGWANYMRRTKIASDARRALAEVTRS
ncbi:MULTISPECIES: hypothetical protein [unclassified Beijerinckia]|uniref:hypothetical protein n=1 Tax=unclassified Beijerinckia TaxID=2638183 RepID=UPI0008951076|nr:MULTISPECIES: hypothetical protein [unclassified Beijerinckia]MDH7797721.1 hypothetical protein [Beijerinckia sp. GAS462]SEC96292.1 hypothetical protein SAMN05443249_4014 [Beijerinckia sp. 28-YEA-48]